MKKYRVNFIKSEMNKLNEEKIFNLGSITFLFIPNCGCTVSQMAFKRASISQLEANRLEIIEL